MRTPTKMALPLVLALAAGVATANPAAARTVCDDEIRSETISDDLLVPRDGFCVLDDVVVTGDLVISRNADVSITDSIIEGDVEVGFDADAYVTDTEIRGDLFVRQNGFADLLDTSVDGHATLQRAFGVFAEDSEVGGDVVSSRAELLWTVGSHLGGDVDVDRRTELFVDRGWVRGDVIGTAARYVDLLDSVVEGGLTALDTEQGALVCESEVDGDVEVSRNQQVVQIGADGPLGACALNVVGGDLTLDGNRATTLVSHNVIRGDLACDGNDPAPQGEGNRVRGQATGQCADLQAPAAAGLRSFSGALASEDRREEAEARLEVRRDASEVELADR